MKKENTQPITEKTSSRQEEQLYVEDSKENDTNTLTS